MKRDPTKTDPNYDPNNPPPQRTCLKCGTRYAHGQTVCRRDGFALVDPDPPDQPALF